MPITLSEMLRSLGAAGALANVEAARREERRREALVDDLLAAVSRADQRRERGSRADSSSVRAA
jgi:hypothetical protein